MQVNLLAMHAAGVVPSRASGFLLPELLKATGISPQAQALREQREDNERRGRGDDRQPSLVAGANQSPARIIQEAERKMLPTSQAAKRELLADQQRRATQERGAFQRSLVDAAARGSKRGAGRASEGASEPASQRAGGPAARPERSAQGPGGSPATESRAQSPRASAESDGPRSGAPPARGLRPASLPNPGVRTSLAPSAPPAVPQSGQKAFRAAAPPRAVESLPNAGRAAGRGAAPASLAKPEANSSGRAGGNAVAAAPASGGPVHKTAASAARAARATAPETGKADANIERILRVVRSQISQDRAQATLRLDPPELGRIRLHMDLRQDALSLRIDTQTPLAHRLLAEQLDSLRHGLESTGIRLAHVEIRPPAATSEPGQSGLPDQPGAGQKGQENTADANAEHSPEHGTESTPTPPADTPARETTPEPAAESLVNILA